jgi:small G protein signaling modulator 3
VYLPSIALNMSLAIPSSPTVPLPRSSAPVHAHPLLADDPPSGSRRRNVSKRQQQASKTTPSGTDVSTSDSYFVRKEQLDGDAHATLKHTSANWDGSMRGYSTSRVRGANTVAETSPNARARLPIVWDDDSIEVPLFVVGSSRDAAREATDLYSAVAEGHPNLGRDAISTILSTQWHSYSDEAIQSAISALSSHTDTPASGSSHPYHATIRVLSSASHHLSVKRAELKEERKVLQEKELARKERAEALIKELQISEREVARRVIQSLFTDDDEDYHMVQRKQSHIVCVNFTIIKAVSLIKKYSHFLIRSQKPWVKRSSALSHPLCRRILKRTQHLRSPCP